jgi:hypothetical protein
MNERLDLFALAVDSASPSVRAVVRVRVGVRFPLEDCNVIGSYVESCCKTSGFYRKIQTSHQN